MTLRKARIEVSNAVFSLPYQVAKEEGNVDSNYDRIIGAKIAAAA